MTTNQPGGSPADRDELIAEFLRTSREMVAAQRDVLLAYLGTAPGQQWAPPAPVAAVPPGPRRSPPPSRLPAAVPPAGAQDPGGHGPEAGVLQVVLDIISERTGYPVDMIEPDLDLEADLSVDSIKRAEIAGELAAPTRCRRRRGHRLAGRRGAGGSGEGPYGGGGDRLADRAAGCARDRCRPLVRSRSPFPPPSR